MTMEPQAQRVSKARAGLILDAPFFGALSLRLEAVADPTAETAWTDGRKMGYNPAWLENMTLEQIKGLWAHEVLHCALSHHVRRGARDNGRWNLATDQAINHVLVEAGFILPADPGLDASYRNKAAEEIYNLMGQAPGEDPGQGGPGQGPGPEDPGGCGAVRDAQGDQGQALGPQDQAQAEADWKVAVTQAAQAAKAMGTLPGGLSRLVQELVNPRTPPEDLLRQFVELTARNDYAWTPPNRRYICQGLYLPSLRSAELPPIAIIVDTSGSVDQADLDQYAGLINRVLEAYQTELTVIYVDTDVQGPAQVFTRADMPLTLQAQGGGGTDFRPGFKWIEEQGLTPAAVIYLTDLECSRFPSDPGYPVVWATIGAHDRDAHRVPFGEVIPLD